MEWILVLLFDLFLMSGLGLICAGASAFKVTAKANQTDLTLLKIGIIIFLIGWIILCAWSLASLLSSQRTPNSPTYEDASKVRFIHYSSILHPLSKQAGNKSILTHRNTASVRYPHRPAFRRPPLNGQHYRHHPPNPEPKSSDRITRSETRTQFYT